MENVTIRSATAFDMETLLHFEQGVISTERPFDSTLKVGMINYYDLQGMISSPDVELAVAVLGDKVIGSGYARIESSKVYLKHARHAYLGFMYTDPEFRGKGVNQQIIDYLRQWAISKNINELRLEVYYDNLPAIKAYEKVGFKKLMILMRSGTS